MCCHIPLNLKLMNYSWTKKQIILLKQYKLLMKFVSITIIYNNRYQCSGKDIMFWHVTANRVI